jgi:opacity protein-like surface antigen
MKKIILIALLMFPLTMVIAQENRVRISGGWTTANIQDSDLSGNGWNISANYEIIPTGTMVAYGLTIGYMSVSAEENGVKYTVNALPIYFHPRLYFSEGKLRPFLQGALGFQLSDQKREGPGVSFTAKDSGLNFSGGVGAIYMVNEKVFLNLEYELMYLANSFYRDDLTNSFKIGLGFRF